MHSAMTDRQEEREREIDQDCQRYRLITFVNIQKDNLE